MRPSAFTSVLLFCAPSCLFGCGASEYSLAPVSGTVTLDGEPLANATVVFQPKTGNATGKNAPGSVGLTSATGSYQLKTIDNEPGAAPGHHRVRIYSYSPESAPIDDRDTGENKERVPERYNYRSTLMYEVAAEGTDAADFQLTTGSIESR